MSLSGTDLPTSILFCRLCQSLYRNPCTLPCLHSFCADCLGQLKPTHDATGEAVSLTCPVCNQAAPLPASGVGGFTANDFLARMCNEYVGEVQRTLVTSARPMSPATSGSPRSTSTSSPSAFSSTTLVGSGSYFQKPEQQQQQTRGYYGYQTVSGAQTVAPPTLSSNYTLQPTAAASSSFSHALSPPRHSSSTSSSSSEVVLQTARRLSAESTPSRGVGVGRRLSSTPKDVVRTWECLQRKLNGLHAASLQATYSLETINMHETNWHQRKQDLRRDIQRRSAQLQFFIKRQERLLLAALDSRGTDESFTVEADRTRTDVRQNLKALMHEIDTLRSVLDLATDSELLSLSALLLNSTVPQTKVDMETPELRFVVPGEVSLEDMVSRDFGCLTSTIVSNVIFTPENIEQVFPEEEEEEVVVEEEDDEAFVTDTYTIDVPYSSHTAPSAFATSSASAYCATSTSTPPTTHHATTASTTMDTCEQNEYENVAFMDDVDDDDAGDEDEDEEEEVVVEETFEIIDGKMTVVSKKSYPTRKPLSPRGSSRTSSTTSSPSRREEGGKDKSSARASLRLATTTTTASTRTATTTGGEAGASQRTKEVSPRGRATETRRTVNSSPTTANVPSGFTTTMKTTTTTEQTQTQKGTGTSATRPTDRRPSEEPGSPPPEHQQQPRTMESFQHVREELRQKRRELLANASIFAMPRHPEVAYLVTNREKRVQSLDRRSSGPTLYRSHSPASPRERQPTVAAPLIHTPRHSSDSEDSVHSDPLVDRRRQRGSSGEEGAGGAGGGGAGRGIFIRHERSASSGGSGGGSGAIAGSRAQASYTTTTASTLGGGGGGGGGVGGVGGGVGSVQFATSSSSSATSPPGSPSTVLTTTVTTGLAADRAAGSRPVRRAISAASDRASKMEYLRETWLRRKELLIQNEAFTPAASSAAPHAEPEDDIEGEGGDEDSSTVESKESEREAPGAGNEKTPGSPPGTGHHSGDAKSSSKIKQSIRSRITNLKHALMKNGGKGGGGGEEGKQLDSAKSPEKKRGAELSTLSPPIGRRAAVPVSFSETPAEQKVLKTVDSILQKRNVPIPDPKVAVLTLSPSKSQQVSGSLATAPAPLSTSQTSPTGSTKPSLMVRPSPRDPLPSTETTSTSSTISSSSITSPSSTTVVPALETLAEDEGSGVGGQTATMTTLSPSRKSTLRPTSPDTSKEKIQQAKAIMRRKKERWRSLSLT